MGGHLTAWQGPAARLNTNGTVHRTPMPLQAMYRFQSQETGYQQIQGTKPQTLGYALYDSPVGLAAWILEKFKVSGATAEGARWEPCLVTGAPNAVL